jgi:hypothetical protein
VGAGSTAFGWVKAVCRAFGTGSGYCQAIWFIIQSKNRPKWSSLDSLIPQERHKLYNMLRLRVFAYPDEPPEVQWEWELPESTICKTGTMETRFSRSLRRIRTSTWTVTSGTKTSRT